jgi:hypothetical protein
MKNVFKFLAITALAVVIGLSFTACGDGSGDNGGGSSGGGGGGSGGGSLKGTSWEVRNTSSDSMFTNNYTTTITFTTADMLTIKEIGWYDMKTMHVNGYNITYTTTRTNVNETYSGTYTYFPSTKEGYMNSDYWRINPWNFRILSDNKTMAGKLDTEQFTKK